MEGKIGFKRKTGELERVGRLGTVWELSLH
jgi:hypothetical protein